jgi:hypothetical protein
MAFPTLIRNLCRHKSVAVSLVVIVTVVCLAVLAPWVAPHDPNMQYFGGLTMEGAPLPPNDKFLLGTDLLGRDLLSRLRGWSASYHPRRVLRFASGVVHCGPHCYDSVRRVGPETHLDHLEMTYSCLQDRFMGKSKGLGNC